jgi:hypothetical protein
MDLAIFTNENGNIRPEYSAMLLESGDWMTVADAQEALGISDSAVCYRCQSGTLKAAKAVINKRQSWIIRCDSVVELRRELANKEAKKILKPATPDCPLPITEQLEQVTVPANILSMMVAELGALRKEVKDISTWLHS